MRLLGLFFAAVARGLAGVQAVLVRVDVAVRVIVRRCRRDVERLRSLYDSRARAKKLSWRPEGRVDGADWRVDVRVEGPFGVVEDVLAQERGNSLFAAYG